MSQCSICCFPAETLAAIDDFLRAGLSLDRIVEKTGASRSSLHRHKQHVAGVPHPQIVHRPEEANEPNKTPAVRQPARVPFSRLTPAEPVDADEVRQRVTARNEALYAEAMSGLELAKQPVKVQRGQDTIEIPGDMRAQAAFLRVAGDRVNFDAQLHGLLDPQARHVSVNVLAVIMSPKDEPDTIDIQPLSANEPADQTTQAPDDGAASPGGLAGSELVRIP